MTKCEHCPHDRVESAPAAEPAKEEGGGESMAYEHPEDKAMRLASEASAAKHIDAFVRDHADQLKALIQVYADRKAIANLELLRELFWTSLPSEDSK